MIVLCSPCSNSDFLEGFQHWKRDVAECKADFINPANSNYFDFEIIKKKGFDKFPDIKDRLTMLISCADKETKQRFIDLNYPDTVVEFIGDFSEFKPIIESINKLSIIRIEYWDFYNTIFSCFLEQKFFVELLKNAGDNKHYNKKLRPSPEIWLLNYLQNRKNRLKTGKLPYTNEFEKFFEEEVHAKLQMMLSEDASGEFSAESLLKLLLSGKIKHLLPQPFFQRLFLQPFERGEEATFLKAVFPLLKAIFKDEDLQSEDEFDDERRKDALLEEVTNEGKALREVEKYRGNYQIYCVNRAKKMLDLENFKAENSNTLDSDDNGQRATIVAFWKEYQISLDQKYLALGVPNDELFNLFLTK